MGLLFQGLVPLDFDIDSGWIYEYSAYDTVDYIPSDYDQTIYFAFSIFNSSDEEVSHLILIFHLQVNLLVKHLAMMMKVWSQNMIDNCFTVQIVL